MSAIHDPDALLSAVKQFIAEEAVRAGASNAERFAAVEARLAAAEARIAQLEAANSPAKSAPQSFWRKKA